MSNGIKIEIEIPKGDCYECPCLEYKGDYEYLCKVFYERIYVDCDEGIPQKCDQCLKKYGT